MTRDEAWKAIEREGRFAAGWMVSTWLSVPVILALKLHPTVLLIPVIFFAMYLQCVLRAYSLSKEFLNAPESSDVLSIVDPSISRPIVYQSPDTESSVSTRGPHVDRALSPQERRDD